MQFSGGSDMFFPKLSHSRTGNDTVIQVAESVVCFCDLNRLASTDQRLFDRKNYLTISHRCFPNHIFVFENAEILYPY